jgi:DNA-binding transcriptional LysR family regulator
MVSNGALRKLPDLEALAIFARVADVRSFVRAATEMGVSKATVSKAVARLEARLGARLFHRTSRRLSLTDAGAALVERASRMLGEAEAAEGDALAQSAAPRGLVRVAAPMSFGLAYVAPALPAFMEAFPDVVIDLNLSDELVDLIGGGFDVALRIGALPDSSLTGRRLCEVKRLLVGAPAYFARHGRPSHPRDLAGHACLSYAYLPSPQLWRFVGPGGEDVSVRPSSRLRANNGDALTPALLAGRGLAVQPEFVIGCELAQGRLEAVMTDWASPPIALHLLTPGGGLRPARVNALIEFLTKRFVAPDWARRGPNGPSPLAG